MAIYIPIRKLTENMDSVAYSFGDALEFIAQIDKTSGEIRMKPVDDGVAIPEVIASRVKRKLSQHWASGVFPDATCWAS